MITSLVVLISLFFFSSCTNTAEEALEEQKSRLTVDFNTFQVEVEGVSRNSSEESILSEAAERLSFAIFDAEGNLVGDAIHQEYSDDDFGSVQMELYSGEYTLVALAHSGNDDATITSATSATLPGTTLSDTFAKVQTLTVTSGEDCSLDMTLTRITSAFILKLTDETLPDNLKEIKVVINASVGNNPTSLDVNPSTGLALANWRQEGVIPKANLSDDNLIYFIGMIKDASVTVKATAYDTDNKKIVTRTLNNVSLKPNHKTVATGKFFVPPTSGNLGVDNTWGDDNHIEY